MEAIFPAPIQWLVNQHRLHCDHKRQNKHLPFPDQIGANFLMGPEWHFKWVLPSLPPWPPSEPPTWLHHMVKNSKRETSYRRTPQKNTKDVDSRANQSRFKVSGWMTFCKQFKKKWCVGRIRNTMYFLLLFLFIAVSFFTHSFKKY